MKSKTSSSICSKPRCQHCTPAGRQCGSPAIARSGFCARHFSAKQDTDSCDYSALLLRESAGFQTAGGINFSLGDLYALLAPGRISPRRAAVLAYISSLLLRSLPAIDTDQSPKSFRSIDLTPNSAPNVQDAETDETSENSEITLDLPQPDPKDAVKSSKPN